MRILIRTAVCAALCVVALAATGPAPAAASTTPVPPVLAVGTVAQTSVGLTWSAPVTGTPTPTRFEVRRNGTLIGANIAATATAYTATGLSPDTGYTFTVRACVATVCSSDATLSTTTAPAAATAVAAVAGAASITVSWASSTAAHVWYKTAAAPAWTEWTPAVSDTSPTTITGLSNGVSYVVKVVTANGTTSTDSRPTAAVVPRDVPAAPQPTLQRATTSSLVLAWTPPSANGAAITAYKVYHGAAQVATGTARTYTATGLTASSAYSYRVEACNAIGCTTSPVVSYTTLPLAPTAVVATAGDAAVSVSWTSAASRHSVFYKASTASAWTEWTPGTDDVAPTTVAGLLNGVAYTFTVVAVNDSGSSALAASRTATPRTVPGAPTLTPAAPTATSVRLSYTPGATGGERITSYQIFQGTALVATRTASPFTVTGLTANTAYVYTVRACSIAGCSPASTPATVVTLPAQPTLTATRADGRVAVRWTIPGPGENPVVYTLRYRQVGAAVWAEWVDAAVQSGTPTVTGLLNGVSYEFVVVATNAGGSAPSAPRTAVPAGVPMVAPAPVSREAVAQSTTTVSWPNPTNTGGFAATGFQLYRNAALLATVGGNVRSYTFTNLTAGTMYTYQIKVCNSAGCSPISSALDIATRVAPPTTVSATSTPAGVALTWVGAPGPLVEGYRISYRTNTEQEWQVYGPPLGAATTSSVAELAAGRYYVRIASLDSYGEVAAGAVVVDHVPATYPDPPGAFTVSPSDTAVQLSWAPPTSDGGAPVAGYVLRYRPTDETSWLTMTVTGTSATLTGLVNGQAYEFQVVAVNAVGPSSPSLTVTAIPATVPGAPEALYANPTAAETITVAWKKPAFDGGSSVVDYVVEYRSGLEAPWKTYDDGVSVSTYTILADLTGGVAYEFRVAAVNAAGVGPAATVSGTPYGTFTMLYDKITFTPGVASDEIRPVLIGATEATFSLEGTLPPGVSFDTSTGVFTGPVDWHAEVVDVTSDSGGNCARMADTTVRCWGELIGPRMGTPAIVYTDATLTEPFSDVVDIEGGAGQYCAIRGTDREVWCWGYNFMGQLGDGSYENRQYPSKVVGITDVVDISVGFWHVCAVLADGTVQCWGWNSSRQLGDGWTTNRPSPVVATGIESATSVAIGLGYSCALLEDATVQCWGSSESSIRSIDGLVDVVQIDGGWHHLCATASTGAVKCLGGSASDWWGSAATVIDSGAVHVSGGNQHTCATMADTTARCWSQAATPEYGNNFGQLGTGDTVNTYVPTEVIGLTGVVRIVAGNNAHSCALRNDGTTYCWGNNGGGQLGDGSGESSLVPVRVWGTGPQPGFPFAVTVTATTPDGRTAIAGFTGDLAPPGN